MVTCDPEKERAELERTVHDIINDYRGRTFGGRGRARRRAIPAQGEGPDALRGRPLPARAGVVCRRRDPPPHGPRGLCSQSACPRRHPWLRDRARPRRPRRAGGSHRVGLARSGSRPLPVPLAAAAARRHADAPDHAPHPSRRPRATRRSWSRSTTSCWTPMSRSAARSRRTRRCCTRNTAPIWPSIGTSAMPRRPTPLSRRRRNWNYVTGVEIFIITYLGWWPFLGAIFRVVPGAAPPSCPA